MLPFFEFFHLRSSRLQVWLVVTHIWFAAVLLPSQAFHYLSHLQLELLLPLLRCSLLILLSLFSSCRPLLRCSLLLLRLLEHLGHLSK